MKIERFIKTVNIPISFDFTVILLVMTLRMILIGTMWLNRPLWSIFKLILPFILFYRILYKVICLDKHSKRKKN